MKKIKENDKTSSYGSPLQHYIEKLMEQSRDVFWVRSSDYADQLYVSSAYEKIWGKPRESLYKHPEQWINSILPEDHERVKKDTERRDHTVIPGQKFLLCYRVIRPDGQIRWIEDESFAIFDDDGNHMGFAGIATDVTEKKEHEIQLQKERARVEEISKVKSEFIANMSHDVKTPLAGVIGMAEVLSQNLKEKNEYEFAQCILFSGQQLMKFFDDCLGMTKSSGSDIIIVNVPFSLKSLLNEITVLFQPAVKSKGLSFSIHYNPVVPDLLRGSRIIIYRILVNLIGNAIKFTTTGFVKINVQYKEKSSAADSTKAVIQFSIEDSGIGIPEDKKNIIFENVTRLVPSYQGTYEGYGIGLFIVRKFVETLHGEIYVKSIEGQGSQFVVLLPIEIPLLDSKDYEINNLFLPKEIVSNELVVLHNSAPLTKKEPGSVSKNTRPTILLVEDGVIAQKIAQSLLDPLSQRVDVADTGEQALNLFKPGRYDLIFMDIGLPGISGYDVSKRIREIEIENGIVCPVPIVALTAHVGDMSSHDLLSMGIQDILSKPLSSETAKKVIEQYASHCKMI